MNLEVIKKDGRLEDFDPDKIARVVTAAGLKPEEGFALALNVDRWAKSQGKTQITTLEIRNKVIEELKKTNEQTANFFMWYEKGKDKNATSSSTNTAGN